ncbi:uncharacterized protein HD556DRAFT_1312464 [Suillus plorans]|uniref:Uncharacterized protein n=1 Tax=Suillus plorans TaxID=116603 RepID=A0A9P7DCL3_9AGAM|nr:uncharacterized protein HD556DRAFT_1312464 [Suillus plorans]KAG1787886.1 hypothetical protein HD556DRAFT_1312464 [Suillus plorans]
MAASAPQLSDGNPQGYISISDIDELQIYEDGTLEAVLSAYSISIKLEYKFLHTAAAPYLVGKPATSREHLKVLWHIPTFNDLEMLPGVTAFMLESLMWRPLGGIAHWATKAIILVGPLGYRKQY